MGEILNGFEREPASNDSQHSAAVYHTTPPALHLGFLLSESMHCCLRRRKEISDSTRGGTSRPEEALPSGLGSRWLHLGLAVRRVYMVEGCPGGVSGYSQVWYRSVSLVRVPLSAYS